MSGGDYCDLCDLPLSTCVHGMPKPPPEEVAPAAARARTPRAKASPVTRSRTTTRAAARTPGAPPAPARPRLRTHQDDFKPWILGVLQDADGEDDAAAVIDRVEERMAAVLLPGDRELGPQGEPRWRTALRWARKDLADDGLLLAPRPGVWALTDAGRAVPSELVARPAEPGEPAGSAGPAEPGEG
ncbi:winged helix-turn-helix domain-containing protein [Nocardioides sp. TRM66260-LWL]|uniref:winged helix-turn-helix domain-containing protein n=1 Tax=Nocardioides sp. TRM66260-LWL TaxID=2874478 RepID=UPI001CC3EB71|nr:winged helix-turn-helix domain-containing protein [Nocardioides sp. TRM66260-LWL]MBZ5734461.1 winged helix-turn-helix domain-containing protein [Nocardioides sp. TRM66260-LWL]